MPMLKTLHTILTSHATALAALNTSLRETLDPIQQAHLLTRHLLESCNSKDQIATSFGSAKGTRSPLFASYNSVTSGSDEYRYIKKVGRSHISNTRSPRRPRHSQSSASETYGSSTNTSMPVTTLRQQASKRAPARQNQTLDKRQVRERRVQTASNTAPLQTVEKVGITILGRLDWGAFSVPPSHRWRVRRAQGEHC